MARSSARIVGLFTGIVAIVSGCGGEPEENDDEMTRAATRACVAADCSNLSYWMSINCKNCKGTVTPKCTYDDVAKSCTYSCFTNGATNGVPTATFCSKLGSGVILDKDCNCCVQGPISQPPKSPPVVLYRYKATACPERGACPQTLTYNNWENPEGPNPASVWFSELPGLTWSNYASELCLPPQTKGCLYNVTSNSANCLPVGTGTANDGSSQPGKIIYECGGKNCKGHPVYRCKLSGSTQYQLVGSCCP